MSRLIRFRVTWPAESQKVQSSQPMRGEDKPLSQIVLFTLEAGLAVPRSPALMARLTPG
jgi:hypothetical protein